MKLPTPSPYRLSVLFAALATMIAGVGCGGRGSGSSIPPPVTPLTISVTITAGPPSAIQPGQSVALTATVANDVAHGGVEWSCTPISLCGSFSPATTNSDVSTTFTAPASSATHVTVTITATSVADNTKSAQATTVILQPASNAALRGQYSFFLTSPTGNRGPSSLLGSITLHGDGTVSGGVADIVSPMLLDLDDAVLPTSAGSSAATSSYSVDPSAHGSMTLSTANGQTLRFSFALTSSAHGLLTEVDGNPGSGTLDLQQPLPGGFAASQVAGGFSFTMTGTDPANSATRLSFGGTFTPDGVNAINQGNLDINHGGVMSSSTFAGTLNAPDSNGRGNLSLSGGRTFTYYVISDKALRIFEADNLALTAGSAYAQGLSSVFLANSSFYEHSGWGSSGLTIGAGQFFNQEMDTVISSGISDSNTGGSPANPHTGVSVSGVWGLSSSDAIGTLSLADAAGSSTFNIYVVDRNVNILDPNDSQAGFFDGAGNGLLLHTDANINGTGVLLSLLKTPSAFVGARAIQLTNSVTTSTGTTERDLSGVLSSDGSTQFTSGSADYDQNAIAGPVLGAGVTGNFFPDAHNPGRYTGEITIASTEDYPYYPFISATDTFDVTYYQITESQAFVMQTDSSANTFGYLLQQIFP